MGKLLRIMLLAIFPVMATGGQAAGQILVLEAEEPVNEIEKQTRNISALIELRKANSPILRGAQGIIVIEVVTNGQAASAGIMVHDVIVTYDEMPINSVAQLVSLIQSNKSGARLVSIGIVRDGQSRSLSLRTGPLGVKIIDVDAAAFQKNQASMQELQQNIQLLEQKIAGANGAPSGLNPSQKIAAIFDPNEPKRPVIPGPACTKCKFEQIPVYWVAKDGKKTIAGHYTGMTRKKIPQGWGRLKLNNGVTIIGTFNAGQPNALTRIVYRNGDRSYLALTSGICGVSSPKLQYKKGQSMIKGRCAPYYKVAGLTYSQNLVALGDHPVNRIASMMIIAGFRPWKLQTVRNESRNSDGWRYAMYTIDTKAFELSYGNAATRKQGERKFLNGRSWSRDRAVRLEYGGGYFRSTPTDPSERNYISPLGAKLGKIQGAWIEDEIPGAVVHRFRNNYPEFSGISPEPHVVNFSDGRRFQGETVDLVPEGFGYELSPDGTQTWGHYHNGRLHGEAVTIKTDGSRQHATYTNGQLDGVVIHSSGSRPPRLDIKTTPSTSLEAPFDLVAGMADQYDAMLTSNKKGAKRFAKEIEKNSPFRGLPINGSFFAQDRSFLAKGWESFYQPPNRSVTDETIEAVRAALAKDQLLGQYVAIGDWYYEAWPSELTLGPQSSYRIEFWRNGVKTGDSDISGWTRCNIANQGAAFFDERARKYTSWADNIHEMTKDYANWWVPASICKGGSADGEGIAISDGGRWIISNGVFSSGRLVSGRRHSFSFNNSGYVGPVSNGMANGWGYQRDELELNQRYKKKMNRYYRGEFKDGEFDGQGSLFYNGEVIRGTFAKGLLDGPVIKLRDQRREDLIYRAGIKTGPMSKVAIQYFVGGQQLVRTTGSYDDQGQFDGPYKETRDDGFVLFEGSMLRGGRTGIQSSIVEMPYRYDFSRAKNLWGIGDDGALLSAELIDPELSSASKFRTLRTTLENGRAVWLTDTADDGTLLYEGTVIEGTRRLSGRCFFGGRYEQCEYLNDLTDYSKRIDVAGVARRARLTRIMNTQNARGKADVDAKRAAEARQEQLQQARIRRDEENNRRWAAERAADRRQAQQADRDLFRRVYGGGGTGSSFSAFSPGSGSDLNDPLNPNNPINLARNQRVAETMSRYQADQQKAKADYQAQLDERTRQIEAARVASLNARIAAQNNAAGGQNAAAGSAPSENWDCDRQWRADKCGDRHTVHEINRLNNAYTPGGPQPSPGGNDNATGQNETSASASGIPEANQGNTAAAGTNPAAEANAAPAMGEARPEALAICRPNKNKPDFWWCDGPIQKLILADEPLTTQLDYVGCQNADPVNQRLSVDTDRYVFFCKYGIQDQDRNIASIYSLPGHILVKRKNYQCGKYQSSKCTTVALP